MTSPRRIHIVGRKNSGKTTLVVELVRHLTAKGLRVGTIKHTHHHHELDTPSKDSHRHRVAGAAFVGILAPNMQAAFWPNNRDQPDSDPYERLTALFGDCDLLLVEGDIEARAIKLEVWRAANHSTPYAAERTDIAALISDDPLELALPRWPRGDISALAERVLSLSRGVASR